MDGLEYKYIETNGINLQVIQMGPEGGRLILMLHGFPEFWYGWRKQMGYLADKGYWVWAPDQRGYNLSDKPSKVSDYQMADLVEDIAGLIKASGKEKAILVGHDWGGIVAWRTARQYPELIERLVVMNAPHEAAMIQEIRKNPLQILRSMYAVFFQIREIPEKMLNTSDWKPALQMLKSTSRKGTFTNEDLEYYRNAWSQTQAMTSMLNWYRANVSKIYDPPLTSEVNIPVMLIWGAKDQFLSRNLALESIKWCRNGRLIFFENATHWVQLEEAERINPLVVAFIEDENFLNKKLVSLK